MEPRPTDAGTEDRLGGPRQNGGGWSLGSGPVCFGGLNLPQFREGMHYEE